MKVLSLILALGLVGDCLGASIKADQEEYGANCFSSSETFGRSDDIVDIGQSSASDKELLDNISRSIFGNASRVTAIKYCFDIRTQYLNYLQAGFSNGIGSEITWLKGIGLDDSLATKKDIIECGMYHVEHRDKRVSKLEIGYYTADLPEAQGVIWVGITVDIAAEGYDGGGAVDAKVIQIGQIIDGMSVKSIGFNQQDNAFMGFVGKTSLTSTRSIVQLGAVAYKCWEDEIEFDKTLKDNIDDFYEEYEPIVWLTFVILLLIIAGCILCGCWILRSVSQVNRLRRDKDKLSIRKPALGKTYDESDPLASQTDLEHIRNDMQSSIRGSQQSPHEQMDPPRITIEMPTNKKGAAPNASDVDNSQHVKSMMQLQRHANKLRTAGGNRDEPQTALPSTLTYPAKTTTRRRRKPQGRADQLQSIEHDEQVLE